MYQDINLYFSKFNVYGIDVKSELGYINLSVVDFSGCDEMFMMIKPDYYQNLSKSERMKDLAKDIAEFKFNRSCNKAIMKCSHIATNDGENKKQMNMIIDYLYKTERTLLFDAKTNDEINEIDFKILVNLYEER